MKPEMTEWTIVIPGLWNERIFTPEWITKYLYVDDPKKIEIEIPAQSGLPFRFIFGNLLLIPQSDRIIVGLKTLDDDTLKRAEELALKILETLPHTPIFSFGINFGFDLSNHPEFAALFNTMDIKDLSENRFEIIGSEIKHTLKQTVGQLNLKLSVSPLEPSKLKIHLNFHHPVDSATTAKSQLTNHVMECKRICYDVIQKVYKLRPEGEDTNGTEN